jgi:anti-anti-sigma factor
VSDSIRYAELNGVYILKFEGDIRVTLCASLDEFIDRMFANDQLKYIILDLSQAKNIDSTALGMIAKIAVQSQANLKIFPLTLSTNPDVDRILECMGLPQVLNIVESLESVDTIKLQNELKAISEENQFKDMPLHDHSQEYLCEKVLEAHKTLMSLNQSNKIIFHDLVSNLEEERNEYCVDKSKP